MNWKDKVKNDVTCVDQLKLYFKVDNEHKLKEIVKRHPMKIPDYYLNLINPHNENDPIRKLSVPTICELDVSGDYDTSGESENTILPGIQHKYKQTVLVLTTNECFMYCRHCFRKRFVGYSKDEVMSQMDAAVKYIKEHPEVTNVLLSGGDAFCLPTETIKEYILRLKDIDHLDFIRFGTRSLVVFPQRIYDDPALLEVLHEASKQKKIYVVTQFNHPNELTEDAKKAIKMLLEAGIMINNQTVLLKGINDDPDILAELLNTLVRIGINPYYVFQCRPVKSVKSSFQLPIITSLRIVEEAKKKLNGFSKRFKFIMSHVQGKIEIVGEFEGKILFKFHQAKNEENAGKMFVREINPKGKWLNNDLMFIE